MTEREEKLLTAAKEILGDFDRYGKVLQTGDNGEYGMESSIGMLNTAILQYTKSSEPQHGREPEADNQANTKPCPYNEAVPCVQYPDDSCGCDPCEECEIKLHAPKSLAQYLAGYLGGYLNGETLPRKLLGQALDAYESTENVMIQIIKKKAR